MRAKNTLRFAYAFVDHVHMTHKRTLSVSIKMSDEDMEKMNKAAAVIWPKAVLTRSSIVLGFARIGADTVLADKSKKKP